MLNTQGLIDFKKLESVLCWIKYKNCDIVLLQETHCVTNKEDVGQKYWDGNIIYEYGTSQKVGVAILFLNRMLR